MKYCYNCMAIIEDDNALYCPECGQLNDVQYTDYNSSYGSTGELQQLTRDPNYNSTANSVRSYRNGRSKQQVKNDYYQKLIEKQQESEKQQWEINATLSELEPKYAKRKASYDRSLISMKDLIIPAVLVAIIILIIILSGS